MTTTGLRRLLALGVSLLLTPAAQAADARQTHSAYWWDPADSGWGVYTFDQGNLLAPYWITYDENGKPTWFMGLAQPQPDGSYRGTLYRYTGTPFGQITGGRASQPGVQIGQVELVFDADPKKMRFTHTLDGHSSTREVTRFNFNGKDVVCRVGPAARAGATNYTDMWWEPSSSGWDLNIMHLDENLYAQWHTYDSDGRAVYMTLGLSRQGDGRYAGKIYRQNDGGRPYKSAGDMSAQPGGVEVGEASLLFLSGERAEFDYVVGSTQGHHRIQRLQAGTEANVCTVETYSSGGGTPGDAELCWPEYAVGDTRTYRGTSTSDGVTSTTGPRTDTITGTGTFNGQSGLVEEIHGPTSGATGVYARNYVGNGSGVILSFGAEALDPANGQVISTSRNDPARVEAPRSFQIGQTVAIDYGVDSTSAAGGGRTEIKSTYRLVGREQVTVPAGTFNACKFEVTIDQRSTIAGSTVQSLWSGHNWVHEGAGRIKQDMQGTSTVTAFGFSTTSQLGATEELQSATVGGQTYP